MRKLASLLVIWLALFTLSMPARVMAQGGMMPGPGTPHTTGGGGGPTLPTFVSATSSLYTVTGASVNVTVPTITTGDFLVETCNVELGSDTFSTPTGSVGTWTTAVNAGTGASAGTMYSTLTATSGGTSVVINAVVSGSTSDHKGCTITVWQHTNGLGNAFNNVITGTAASPYVSSLTTSAAHSAIVWSCTDFTAGAVTSVNATPTATASQIKAADGARYTNYVQYLADQAAAGAVNVGVTGSGTSAGPYNCAAVEVKGQ